MVVLAIIVLALCVAPDPAHGESALEVEIHDLHGRTGLVGEGIAAPRGKVIRICRCQSTPPAAPRC